MPTALLNMPAIGHVIHAATYGLRRNVFNAIALAECLCRVQAPQARARPNQAVLRGGGCNNNALNVRAPNRNRNAPAHRNDNIGFRCAKTPHPAVVAVPES